MCVFERYLYVLLTALLDLQGHEISAFQDGDTYYNWKLPKILFTLLLKERGREQEIERAHEIERERARERERERESVRGRERARERDRRNCKATKFLTIYSYESTYIAVIERKLFTNNLNVSLFLLRN